MPSGKLKLNISMVARMGNQVGMGHWGRSLNLAKEFSARGHKVFLQSISDATHSHPTQTWGSANPEALDVQVIDDPLDPFSLISAAKLRVGIDFFKDDTKGDFHILVNAIDRTPEPILRHSSAVRLVGMDYLLVDPQFGVQQRVDRTPIRLLVSIGGLDIKGSTFEILTSLRESGRLSRINEGRIILSGQHRDRPRILEWINTFAPQFECFDTQESLYPFLGWANLVFCNGGMIAMLAALQRRACVYFPQAKEEEELLRELGANPRQVVSLTQIPQVSILHGALTCALTTPKIDGLNVDTMGPGRVVSVVEERWSHQL